MTPVTGAARRLDLGRLVLVPLFAMMIVASGMSVTNRVQDFKPTAGTAAELTRAVLVLGFYCLLVRFYLLRGTPVRSATSLPAHVIAMIATFLPFTLPAVLGETSSTALLVAASIVTAGGMAWSVWALRHLGRSISMIAQARALVTSGPYRLVRHPLYAGELVAFAGVVLSAPSVAAVLVLLLAVALQAHRAVHEEAVLTASFAEYVDYSRQTARFIPGVV